MNHEQKIENAVKIIVIDALERGRVSDDNVVAIDYRMWGWFPCVNDFRIAREIIDRLNSEFPRADELRIALECLWACLDEMDVTA